MEDKEILNEIKLNLIDHLELLNIGQKLYFYHEEEGQLHISIVNKILMDNIEITPNGLKLDQYSICYECIDEFGRFYYIKQNDIELKEYCTQNNSYKIFTNKNDLTNFILEMYGTKENHT